MYPIHRKIPINIPGLIISLWGIPPENINKIDAIKYLKKTTVVGDVSEPADLAGVMLALGTTSQSAGGIFIKTEAGITNYGQIEVDGQGNTINSGVKVQADPTIAFGTISIGYKF